ncbi:MAG TPA: hypothetical protein VFZ21_19590 [Gemmatimonadaceae bacterium]|jgi:hypothetical protein|nr:hypothetical protein [Gemmatimonadaceae bacterium]
MAEVLVEFDAAIPGGDGSRYTPRACARVGPDGLWEGWIEFTNVDTGGATRTGRETTQPTRDDVMYWATGLSRVYLEGALARALMPPRRVARPTVSVEPAFDGPAPLGEPADMPLSPRPVIDPFEVYAQGENVLRQELLALSIDHLRAIVRAHGLDGGAGAQAAGPEVLAEYIVAEVRARAAATRSTSVSESPYRDAGGDAR